MQMASLVLSLWLLPPFSQEKFEPGKDSGNSSTAMKTVATLASPEIGH